MLGFFFEFSNGVKLYINAESATEAMEIVDERWYSGIFNKYDFSVKSVTGQSL